MDNKQIQPITRVLGVICLALVVIAKLFKSQSYIPQNYLPYLTILSLMFLSISVYLKAKSGAFKHYHLPLKMTIVFVLVVVLGIFLINYFTT